MDFLGREMDVGSRFGGHVVGAVCEYKLVQTGAYDGADHGAHGQVISYVEAVKQQLAAEQPKHHDKQAHTCEGVNDYQSQNHDADVVEGGTCQRQASCPPQLYKYWQDFAAGRGRNVYPGGILATACKSYRSARMIFVPRSYQQPFAMQAVVLFPCIGSHGLLEHGQLLVNTALNQTLWRH